MNEVIRIILKRAPAPPSRRAHHGEWTTPAWAVKGLVEQKGYGVSDAVRETMKQMNIEDTPSAFDGIRAAYYVVKPKSWPK